MPTKFVTAKVQGIIEARRALKQLVPRVVQQAVRKGIDDAGKLVLAAEKTTLVAKRTGSLKKALGRKTVARKDGHGFTAVVGPRRDPSPKKIEASVAQVAAGKRKTALKTGKFRKHVKFAGRLILVNPVKYAHLVEFGRKAVRIKNKKILSDSGTFYGKSVDRADPKPFRAPAYTRSKAAAEAAVKKRVAAAVASVGRR